MFINVSTSNRSTPAVTHKPIWLRLLPLGLLTACLADPITTQTEALSTASVVAKLERPNKHTLFFIAPVGGPAAIGELAPNGSPSEIEGTALAGRKISDIYSLLTGQPAPTALIQSEETLSPAVTTAPPSSAISASAGHGPQFYNASDTNAFKATYCTNPIDECVVGVQWASGSYGNHQGRGYLAHSQNGSEAIANRITIEEYWTGSAWSSLYAPAVPPGSTWILAAGNTGASNCSDGSWYFRGRIQDNGVDGATVAFQDHMYSKGGGGVLWSCYDTCGTRGMCHYVCDATTGHNCGDSCTCSGTVGFLSGPDFPVCSDDHCCNPP